jgi:glycosyltransferase involved in cell wall biosynthesis
MHLAVDASPLLLRSAGVKNYLYHWIVALRQTGAGHNVSPFPFLDQIGDLTHEQSTLSPWQTVPRIAFLLGSNYGPGWLMRLANHKADVFHATNQVHHPVPGMALTTTLHDLTCWLMPELHTPANVEADKRFAAQIAAKADGLIAVSENTRQDAIRLLRLPPEKIVTIHSGVDNRFFQATTADAEALRVRLGLTKPFVLNLGTVEPRKNLDTLLDAWAQLRRDDFELVLAGPMGWAAGATAQRIRSGPPGVRYLGYVAERDLPALTKAAAVFAYPSLYEGFGFPVAQAMACGVPVLTSNTSCLPEITAEGALHVDPRSVAELAAALGRLLDSPELRSQLGAAGQQRARDHFQWGDCARKSWDFFRRYQRS